MHSVQETQSSILKGLCCLGAFFFLTHFLVAAQYPGENDIALFFFSVIYIYRDIGKKKKNPK